MDQNEVMIGEGVPFDHYGRITGYLAKIEKFNDAKKEEFKDRVKHDSEQQGCNC